MHAFRRYLLNMQMQMGVDLAGILEGRMASAEGSSVPSRVAYGEESPLPSRLRAKNRFWCILKAIERTFCTK